MKKFHSLIAIFAMLGLTLSISCEKENVAVEEELQSVDHKWRWKNKCSEKNKKVRVCKAVNVDRCPFGDRQPEANFWWPETETDYFNPTTYFGSDEDHKLKFVEFENGTALIRGYTKMGDCVVKVKVWLVEKKDWHEWSADGGGHKKEGCAGNPSVSENMVYYVINSDKSYIYAEGSDCIAEGKYGVEQRPDPNDASTPNYGFHLGVGGANYDSDTEAEGMSGWGWITDYHTGERLWVMDFNFKLDCVKKKRKKCKYKNKKWCKNSWYHNY